MKLFFRGLIISLWAGICLTFSACSSMSGGNSAFLDTPQQPTHVVPSTTENTTTVDDLLPQPAPSQDVARFGIGQTVIISFSGPPIAISGHEEVIKEDGTINLDYIGSIKAAGKTACELQYEIQTNYVPKYYTRLTVTVKSGDRVYYVSGEVRSTGRQLYVGDTTVSKAIQSAGGLSEYANHKKVWLIRASDGKRIR